MDPTHEGGCDGKRMGEIWGGVAIAAVILMTYYVGKFMKDMQYLKPEGMCGGVDQCCQCSGNETMASGRTRAAAKSPAAASLARSAAGY